MLFFTHEWKFHEKTITSFSLETQTLIAFYTYLKDYYIILLEA
jgi:hypothetical protein